MRVKIVNGPMGRRLRSCFSAIEELTPSDFQNGPKPVSADPPMEKTNDPWCAPERPSSICRWVGPDP